MALGRTVLHPLDYTGICRHLVEAEPFDIAVGQFTMPDAAGWCSPGLTADFLPLVWTRANKRVGHFNTGLPRLDSSFRVHVSEFDAIVEAPTRPLTVKPSTSGTAIETIGRHAASLIQDGDTLQCGIGSVLPEVARALHGHRRLRVRSGMVSPWLQTLWESGSLDRDAQIVTGAVFGDTSFYDYVGRLGRVRLEDVRSTHAIRIISQIQRFVAVNSAVEVDLFGQVNSERSDGSLQAGAGGLPAFAQAAQPAPQGRLLICLPATARGGNLSRLVPCLDSNSLCTVPRHQADAVVTEFGVAQLRGLSVDQRSKALIAIAHPDHRAQLSSAWDEIVKRL
jgi:acyl-CoA hydrolase